MWSFFSRDPIKDFHYDIGDRVSGLEDKSLWNLHEGKRKSNGEQVSIFIFDVKSSSPTQLQVAKASMKRLKTLRHPRILTYLDELETEKALYFVTEAVVPLPTYLSNNSTDSASTELAISWGLHQIVKALSFLINDCSLIHNNVCVSSIFVDRAGEWKLGGMDYTYPASGSDSVPPIKILPTLEKYDPPERTAKKQTEKWSTDMWSLGCLIWEAFNGEFAKTTSLKSLGKIPKSLVANYCELVSANPKSRPNPAKFLEVCRSKGGFMDNKFVSTMLFLEEIQIQDQEAKNQFFNSLPPVLDSFPQSFCKQKILPQLLHAFEYGNAGSAILAPLFKLGKLLDSDEYQKKIVPCVVKLFSSTDRATRVKLLQQVELFVEHLTPTIVNDQIFPSIVNGFMDNNPVVREHTIKSMLHLASKLNYRNLNEELLKHFARLQSKDDQGGIRTNTTVCLGKIACHLHPQVRQRVLSSAYMRALKDPFPPARQAGILAMAATHNYFTLQESAQRLLPALCALTMDPDKGVRDQAFRAIKCFLGKLEKVSENPEMALEAERDVNTGGAASSTAGWTGWAVSGMTSLTSKIYKGKSPGPPSQPQKPAANVPPNGLTGSDALPKGGPTPKPKTVEAKVTEAPSSREISSSHRDKVQNEELEEPAEEQDEDNDWGDQDWGNMEDVASKSGADSTNLAENEGWDDDGDWGSLEEPDLNQPSTTSSSHPTDSAAPASSYNWDQTSSTQEDEFFSTLLEDKKKKSASSSSTSKSHSTSNSFQSTKTSISTTSRSSFDKTEPKVSSSSSSARTQKSTDDGWNAGDWNEGGDGWTDDWQSFDSGKTKGSRPVAKAQDHGTSKPSTGKGAMKIGSTKRSVE